MDEQGNVSALGVLTDIQTFLSEQDDQTGAVNGSDGSRFAFMFVTLPNGQQFRVQVEEVF